MKLPAVFGHEGAGIVERVGARVAKVQPGDHVAMSYLTCGACPACLKGKPARCSRFFPHNFLGSRMDGSTAMRKGQEAIHSHFFGQSSFASYTIANERNVVKVPGDLPVEIMGPLGCGIQTGAGGVINSLKAQAGSSIAIFGVGSVGISAIMAAVVSGCTKIIAVDIKDDRLTLAKEFGATHTINSAKADTLAEISMIAGGLDYALECAGIPAVLRTAFDALSTSGVCGLIGIAPFGSQVALDMGNILNGRSLIGITMGDAIPDVFIPTLIDLYRQGRFPFDRMVTFYPFEEINQAAKDSEKGKTLKAVLKF
jgi:aryl-alcohol dehydrogenase